MPARTMTVAALREKLERGDPLTVVDIRDADEHAEWSVPGSAHADVYDALAARDPAAFDAVPLPKDRPVAVVCWAGNTSRIAQQVLQARGYDAYSVEGGMRAWSLAWNAADVAPDIVQVRRTGKGCLSYIVNGSDGAAVIDPSLDPDVYVDLAKARGWTIRRVVETHVHADHVSRGLALASRAGATLHVPATTRVKYAAEPVRDGDEVAGLRALATPGHTDESVCYQLGNRAVFTGDTLFLASVGRPDLEASPDATRRRAEALHASLQRLFALPPDALVLPGHASAPVPFDGRPIAARLADVRARVPLAALPPDSFAREILARIPPTPPNHRRIVQLNEAGAPLPSDPTELEAGANRCSIL